jgi:hypothetical protein
VTTARRIALRPLRVLRPSRYTDADPFKVITVPTPRLRHMQATWDGALDLPWLERGRFGAWSSLRRRWHAGRVLDGDWDRAVEPFEAYHLADVLAERYVHGRPWHEIPYIRRAFRKIARGETAWGGRCRTPRDLVARCRYLDALYRRLRCGGYRPDDATGGVAFSHFLVNIGRDGEIIRNNDGKHRIVLARLIGIEALPARVLVRHRQWQALRDRIRRERPPALVARFRDHPDLRDLLGPADSASGRPLHSPATPPDAVND